MVSPENMAAKPMMKHEKQVGRNRKDLLEQVMKCPRCDSPNTKFCYYNNYSLSQPSHFYKTCRRYWTKGGALRNVPIGGGCRKGKKVKTAARLGETDMKDINLLPEIGGFNLFNGLSPAMDFHFGGFYNHQRELPAYFENLSASKPSSLCSSMNAKTREKMEEREMGILGIKN